MGLEDELAEAVAVGRLMKDDAEAVRSTGEAMVPLIEAGAWPFDPARWPGGAPIPAGCFRSFLPIGNQPGGDISMVSTEHAPARRWASL